MSQASPGPWSVCAGKGDCADPLCTGIYDAKGVGIFYSYGKRTKRECRANAVLAAAAPMLFAAAQDARDALRAIRDDGPGLIAQHGDALDALLLAIAKAEGR